MGPFPVSDGSYFAMASSRLVCLEYNEHTLTQKSDGVRKRHPHGTSKRYKRCGVARNRQPLIIIGDVHGKFTDLAHKLLEMQVEHQTVIQLGDFGLGFYPPDGEHQLLE